MADEANDVWLALPTFGPSALSKNKATTDKAIRDPYAPRIGGPATLLRRLHDPAAHTNSASGEQEQEEKTTDDKVQEEEGVAPTKKRKSKLDAVAEESSNVNKLLTSATCPSCKTPNAMHLLAQFHAPLAFYDRVLYVFACGRCNAGKGPPVVKVVRSQVYNPEYETGEFRESVNKKKKTKANKNNKKGAGESAAKEEEDAKQTTMTTTTDSKPLFEENDDWGEEDEGDAGDTTMAAPSVPTASSPVAAQDDDDESHHDHKTNKHRQQQQMVDDDDDFVPERVDEAEAMYEGEEEKKLPSDDDDEDWEEFTDEGEEDWEDADETEDDEGAAAVAEEEEEDEWLTEEDDDDEEEPPQRQGPSTAPQPKKPEEDDKKKKSVKYADPSADPASATKAAPVPAAPVPSGRTRPLKPQPKTAFPLCSMGTTVPDPRPFPCYPVDLIVEPELPSQSGKPSSRGRKGADKETPLDEQLEELRRKHGDDVLEVGDAAMAEAREGDRSHDEKQQFGNAPLGNKIQSEMDHELNQAYMERMAVCPSQIVRWCPGGSPLALVKLPAAARDPNLVPKCRHCGCIRRFEFQVVSPIIYFLTSKEAFASSDFKASNTPLVSTGKGATKQAGESHKNQTQLALPKAPEESIMHTLHFNTILVYTCTGNCYSEDRPYVEEHSVIVLEE